MYNFLFDWETIKSNQSGFRPADSCVNQVLIIMIHELLEAFDCNPSVGISGKLYDLLEDYLSGWGLF